MTVAGGCTMSLTNLPFSYQGRINRAKFWLAALIYFIVGIVVAIVALIPVLGQLVALVVNIAVMVSSVFVGIKRLHDRNKTGWWLLPYYFVPMILFGISFYLGYMADEATPLSMLTSLLGLAAMLWVFVDLGCLRGTIGPNQYGPDPVAPALATH